MKRIARLLALPFAALSLLPLASPAAAATLTGDSVTASYIFPSLPNSIRAGTFVVGAGVEATCPNSPLLCNVILGTSSLDFGSDTISFAHLSPVTGTYTAAAFNGWLFSSLDFGTGITGVTLSSFGISGLDNSRVSFTANTISVNLSNLTYARSYGWSLTMQTTTVPLPASGILLLAALGGMTFLRRRRV